jgi:hypothetical protein
MLTTKTSTRCPGWHPWHCYEYDTVLILYTRQNIVSADMFIKNIVLAAMRGGMIEDGAVLRLFMATMQTAAIE